MKRNAGRLMQNKYNLHSIYKKATENDFQDLTMLLNYILIQDDQINERKNELKKICLKHGINSPFLGEE